MFVTSFICPRCVPVPFARLGSYFGELQGAQSQRFLDWWTRWVPGGWRGTWESGDKDIKTKVRRDLKTLRWT